MILVKRIVMTVKFLRILLLFLLINNNMMLGQQVIDSLFTIDNLEPTYKLNESPLILLDEGHNNGSLLNTSFRPTSNILVNDGYIIKANKDK